MNWNPNNLIFFYIAGFLIVILLVLMALPTLIANEVERRQKQRGKKK
ncbi:MAG: hypothetical protein Q8R11_02980 [bacterium]|nr:hypothetical protein [bacterium]